MLEGSRYHLSEAAERAFREYLTSTDVATSRMIGTASVAAMLAVGAPPAGPPR
jgi:hypothetical protein